MYCIVNKGTLQYWPNTVILLAKMPIRHTSLYELYFQGEEALDALQFRSYSRAWSGVSLWYGKKSWLVPCFLRTTGRPLDRRKGQCHCSGLMMMMSVSLFPSAAVGWQVKQGDATCDLNPAACYLDSLGLDAFRALSVLCA